MKLSRFAPVIVVGAILMFAACSERKGPMERAGESVDRSIDNAGEAIEDVGENIQDKAEGRD